MSRRTRSSKKCNNLDDLANATIDTPVNDSYILNSIQFPKKGEYVYCENCFIVDDKARNYFDFDRKGDGKQKRELKGLSNTPSKISNSIDSVKGGGSRSMEPLLDFNSSNPALGSLQEVLSFFENKTYINSRGKRRSYTLQPSLISSIKKTFPQRFHTDYKNVQYNHLTDEHNIPYVVIFGIDEDTILYLYDKVTEETIAFNIAVGAVLILALDVIHAGAGYINIDGKIHKRVQMYMDTDEILHNHLSPNEWLQLPIQSQPLSIVLENRHFTSESFLECCHKQNLKSFYGLDKKKIFQALVNDENENENERKSSVHIDWNDVSA